MFAQIAIYLCRGVRLVVGRLFSASIEVPRSEGAFCNLTNLQPFREPLSNGQRSTNRAQYRTIIGRSMQKNSGDELITLLPNNNGT
ncbi:hypothetical protein L5515_016913 [Caenorhabditis briggsae]|uniref:Uncharacterized protein n=1 Tax=Caenorhabditis briggsae TaxID=6238 RepID=A0AAE9FE83_CAEBR|nr:hypothetical protein L5515_016913 [Caenorhabditis briggsae]